MTEIMVVNNQEQSDTNNDIWGLVTVLLATMGIIGGALAVDYLIERKIRG